LIEEIEKELAEVREELDTQIELKNELEAEFQAKEDEIQAREEEM
jgi:hypothetical protein